MTSALPAAEDFARDPEREKLRVPALDALRGLGVLLMVIDHVLVVTDPGHPLRFTLTRLSLPFFLLVAGHLWRPGWRRRYGFVLAAGILATVLGAPIGIGQPDVLVVIVVGAVVLTVTDRTGVPTWLVAAVGLALGSAFWPWTGYAPWTVAGWLAVGRLAHLEELEFDAPGWLVAVGRRPLTWYLAHLAALRVLASVGAFT